jgi:magnesium-protoporphyrin O-methyltransferase
MACCAFDETVNNQFTTEKATQELDRYRRKGAGPTTRRLIDGLSRAGLVGGTLLDVGAGVGSLTFELLERGCRRAVIVEASAAYAAAAADEARRRQRSADIEFARGDFLDLAGSLSPASIVTLDRVICCYPLYEPLLDEALRHAEQSMAISYPHDRWYVRAAMGLENAMRRRRKSRFRTFVHPQTHMRQLITRAGFELVSRKRTLFWSADVFVRR